MDLGSFFCWTWVSYQPWAGSLSLWRMLFDTLVVAGLFSAVFTDTGYPVRPKGGPPGSSSPQPIYRPVTAVFVRQGGKTGIVPMHPLDQKGKTPLNLEPCFL